MLFSMIDVRAQNILYLLDDETNKGIQQATLQDTTNGFNYISRENGEVVLNQHTSTLIIRHVAYEDAFYILEATFPINLKLSPKKNPIEEVIISRELNMPQQIFPFNQIKISKKDFFIGERSLSSIISSKSGVLLEERANGSYRVSIRGSSLRSPYGVRNVKVYYYGIPISSAFGLTDFNSIDVSNVDHIEIRKGPTGSIYGAGNGGVLLLNNIIEPSNNAMTVYGGIGSYGLNKFHLRFHLNVKKGSVDFSYSRQGTQGYRDQNELKRQNFQYFQTLNTKKHKFNFLLWGSQLYYQIPGGLTEEELIENPRQARPRSDEQQSSVSQNKIIGGITHSFELKKNAAINSQASIQLKDFKNPFILDYKEEKELNFTFRSVYEKKWLPFSRPLIASLGIEFLSSSSRAKNYENNQGLKANLHFQDHLKASNLLIFQQLNFDLSSKLNLVVALSENFVQYKIDRTIDNINGVVGANTVQPKIEFVPQLSVNYQFKKSWFLFQSISKGFSPPAINEVRTNDGSINKSLNAETIWSYEIGTRYNSPNSMFKIDLSIFFARMNNAITTYTNPQGVSLFQNSGNVAQKGVEAEVLFNPISNAKGLIHDLKITSSYTGHYFKFKNFSDSNGDLNNKQYTGVAPHILVNQLFLALKKGPYFRFSHRYNSSLPLDNENTVFQKEYNVLRIGMGWRKDLSQKVSVDIYCLVDNLLNENYSLGNDLNAFSARYYQPAPGRNWLSGITLSFKPTTK